MKSLLRIGNLYVGQGFRYISGTDWKKEKPYWVITEITNKTISYTPIFNSYDDRVRRVDINDFHRKIQKGSIGMYE